MLYGALEQRYEHDRQTWHLLAFNNDGCTKIGHIVSIGLLTSIGRLDNLSNKCASAHKLVGKSKWDMVVPD